MNNQITVCPMCPDCPDNCPVEAEMGVPDRNVGDMIFRQDAIDVTWEKMTYTEQWNVLTEVRRRLKALPSAQPEDYAELKREFLRMASYIDVLLECSDEQKETLIGFISRLAEFMPWTERD